MKTILNVKTDKEVKEKAQALAKHLGIPLSTIVNAHLKSFIESGEFRVSREPELRPEIKAELLIALKEVREGKGLSPTFSSVDKALDWLHKK